MKNYDYDHYDRLPLQDNENKEHKNKISYPDSDFKELFKKPMQNR